MTTIDLIPSNPYLTTLKNLGKGKHNDTVKEITDKAANKPLATLKDQEVNGTLLGISKYTGKPLLSLQKMLYCYRTN